MEVNYALQKKNVKIHLEDFVMTTTMDIFFTNTVFILHAEAKLITIGLTQYIDWLRMPYVLRYFLGNAHEIRFNSSVLVDREYYRNKKKSIYVLYPSTSKTCIEQYQSWIDVHMFVHKKL